MNSLVKREPLNNNGNVPVDDDTDSKTTTVNGKGLWVSNLLQYKLMDAPHTRRHSFSLYYTSHTVLQL